MRYWTPGAAPMHVASQGRARATRRGMADDETGNDKGADSAPAFLFDLDGTLVDSVYQHVLAWREALERAGIGLAVWRIHRRIGMSGGLLVNALLRETGQPVTREETE